MPSLIPITQARGNQAMANDDGGDYSLPEQGKASWGRPVGVLSSGGREPCVSLMIRRQRNGLRILAWIRLPGKPPWTHLVLVILPLLIWDRPLDLVRDPSTDPGRPHVVPDPRSGSIDPGSGNGPSYREPGSTCSFPSVVGCMFLPCSLWNYSLSLFLIIDVLLWFVFMPQADVSIIDVSV